VQVNDPVPKPLRELQQRKGPGRPLPPTPDDDDTMRRAGSVQLSSGIQRMDSSPGLANRSGPGANNSQVMPDLLPQQSSGVTPTSGGIIRTSDVGSSGAVALQVRFSVL